ncbi:Ubiquinol-cytochrome C reductase hinge protein [Ancylostoma caninum]|uniref:Ubiquinol-cytochrome C reductase hinge protein n=1 Tax=Ancylostoma caninum TaxID=29170 RepID=A0A368FWN6_ANCCA|nr:Ubiquinol-cytochrome C reductase hinge protein [Ancylostoma caninum]
MPGDDEPLQEGVDQVQQWRDRCAEKFTDLKARLDECNDRVNSRKETTETCVEVKRFSFFLWHVLVHFRVLALLEPMNVSPLKGGDYLRAYSGVLLDTVMLDFLPVLVLGRRVSRSSPIIVNEIL